MTRDKLPKRQQRRLLALRARLKTTPVVEKAKPEVSPQIAQYLENHAKRERALARNEARDWLAVYQSERARRPHQAGRTTRPPTDRRLRHAMR